MTIQELMEATALDETFEPFAVESIRTGQAYLLTDMIPAVLHPRFELSVVEIRDDRPVITDTFIVDITTLMLNYEIA